MVYPNKWSPISCRSSAGQGTFAGQGPPLCHATHTHNHTSTVWRMIFCAINPTPIGTFLVRNIQPRGKTELILTVKMETRHPIEGPFGREFSAICNHCGVMMASSRSFVCSLLRAAVQPTLDPSAETFMSIQCASPGRGGELVDVCGVCASCVGWRKG